MGGYDAILLAGGGGRRLGGVDKAAITVGPHTLLERALDALGEADRIVVVGPPRPLPHDIVNVTENPPGSGPAAAVVAGLEQVTREWVVVLACDMPFMTTTRVRLLVDVVAVAADAGQDGATYVDESGRRQPLAAIYRAESLRRSAASLDDVAGASMRALTKSLTLAEIEADSETSLDCDTWVDVARSRDLLEEA